MTTAWPGPFVYYCEPGADAPRDLFEPAAVAVYAPTRAAAMMTLRIVAVLALRRH